MLRSLLKTIFYSLQLLVCFILIVEKTQPTRFLAPQTSGRLPARHASYKQPRYRTSLPPRRRLFSWRRLLFLLS